MLKKIFLILSLLLFSQCTNNPNPKASDGIDRIIDGYTNQMSFNNNDSIEVFLNADTVMENTRVPIFDVNGNIIDLSTQNNNQDLTDSYFCKNCSSPSSRIDIWTIRYDPWSLDQTHFQNARVFEIYAEDLVGHLWRPAQNGVDYQCKIS